MNLKQLIHKEILSNLKTVVIGRYEHQTRVTEIYRNKNKAKARTYIQAKYRLILNSLRYVAFPHYSYIKNFNFQGKYPHVNKNVCSVTCK